MLKNHYSEDLFFLYYPCYLCRDYKLNNKVKIGVSKVPILQYFLKIMLKMTFLIWNEFYNRKIFDLKQTIIYNTVNFHLNIKK